MAFLLFAYRKLSLKRQINQKNYQMTLLSNQQQTIQSQIGMMEQVKASAQDSWATIADGMSSSLNTIFQANTAASTQKTRDLGQQYQSVLVANGNDENNANVKAVKAQLEAATVESNNSLQKAYVAKQVGQEGLLIANHAVNSVFAAGDKAKLAILQHQDQRIGISKDQLESEVKLISAEYENVKKAEGEEAKNVAPSFGLG